MGNASQRVLSIGVASGALPALHSQDFEIESAENIAAAASVLAVRPFDLLLLHVGNAGPASLDLLAQLQSHAPHTPIVLLGTGDDRKPNRDALRLGAQDFLLPGELSAAQFASAMWKAIDRHQAQASSRRDRHLLEILMNNIPDAIYFKDSESRFIRVNQAHARRFHLKNPVLAVGKTDADFFSDEHAHQARVDEVETMRTGQPLVGIEEMETWPDGSITWVSTTKMPLRDQSGRIIGTFGISRDITARKKAELALEERTRQLQQKNEQIADELKMARELQLAMLPQKFPCLPPHLPYQQSALEFFSLFLPNGAVSGDFYDVVELSDTTVGVFICDVMGHDVRAALITAMMRSLVQDLSHSNVDPGKLLAQINHALAGVFKLSGTTMFATAIYLIADVEKGELRYASAAHPEALHVRRMPGEVKKLGGNGHCKGPALGLFDDAAFPTCSQALSEGDVLLMFTDGLIEAEGEDHECFSLERLMSAVQRRAHLPTQELANQLIADIRQFCDCGEFSDDVSVVGIGVKRLGPAPGVACPINAG